MSTNGLDMLTTAREKRKQSARRIPPPRHAPKEPRPIVVESAPAASTPTAVPAAQTATAPAAPKKQAATPAPEQAELRRVTVYLEPEAAEWLDSVLVAGKQMKPRVNSASAVIRLAISRLAEQSTPQETATVLHERAAQQGTQPGRKRV